MICDKCNEENNLQQSHDIPKYLGGTDLDGRHYLCNKHHKEYEKLILVSCLKFIGEELENDSEIIGWMKDLSKQPEELKAKFREIAKEKKEEFYDG